jgi:hypothetical protein
MISGVLEHVALSGQMIKTDANSKHYYPYL